MRHTLPHFNDSERWVVKSALEERYGQALEPDTIDSEIRLSPSDRELTVCAGLYWQVDKVRFVILKTGPERYRCQFFYRLHEQYGTNIEEYDNIGDCVVSLLQTQADHERKRQLAAES